MRRLSFEIPIYDWDIEIVTIYNKEDELHIRAFFDEMEIVDDNAIDNIINERYNGGETYVSASKRIGVILIYKYDKIGTFHNVLNHEKRHLVDRIGEVHLIKDEREAIAYLDGFVSEQIYSNLQNLC